MDDLISKIKPELEDGTDFDMNQVFQMYQEFLENYMSQEDAQKYTHQKLKIKLQTKADFIVFHSAPQANKPDLISHISLKIKDIINKAVDQKKKLKEILTAQSMSCDLSRVELSEMGILFHASLIIQSLRKSNTIFLSPLNPLDISAEKSLSLLNQQLYTFINSFTHSTTICGYC